ncbi:hypothetical protein TNCV_4793901 [Trichonephila clavipes]|nr:hypothetical protein TNCV_4793901 [Trichonephila clavipes]
MADVGEVNVEVSRSAAAEFRLSKLISINYQSYKFLELKRSLTPYRKRHRSSCD